MTFLLSLFLVFAKIGLFGFGGGYAMLPLIFQSVQDLGGMSAEEFSNLVALSQAAPGPIAANAATYVGFTFAGFPGAIVATAGVALPSFVMIILISKFLVKFQESKTIKGILYGIRPATVGLIASAAVFLGKAILFTKAGADFVAMGIFAVTVILVIKFKVSPIIIIFVMGVAGALFIR